MTRPVLDLRLRRAYAWRAANIGAWAAIHAADIHVPVDIDLDLLTHPSMMRASDLVTDAHIVSAQGVANVFTRLGVLAGRADLGPRFDRRFTGVLSRHLI